MIFLNVHPQSLGKWIQFDIARIFQMVLVKPPSSCFLGTIFSESNKTSLKIRESEDFSNHFPLVKTWDFRFGEFTTESTDFPGEKRYSCDRWIGRRFFRATGLPSKSWDTSLWMNVKVKWSQKMHFFAHTCSRWWFQPKPGGKWSNLTKVF